ncbi:unnamed protein product [Psylliodes chrysocephalus]|uniref:C2H2-type domain-containing protein n=1 Tax=Psylliodes chrysocephalus TaxID=3402493 RepID=A0A9P0D2G5_9CUCU|nr:unnamed protein product [Psylliodes chrysocephala]
MDVKGEICDPHEEGVIKIEPVSIYEQNEDQNVIGDIFKSQISVNEFKPELIKYEVSKLEQGTDYQSEIEPECTTVKEELDNIREVKATGFRVMKVEIFEYVQFKQESELLTSHCDLPTLKTECIDYPDYLTESCISKQTQPILKPVCQKSDENPENLTNHQQDSSLGLTSGCCINLEQYLIIDPNERIFQCGICAKQYRHKLPLQNHLNVHKTTFQIHNNESTFQCDICSKEFSHKSNLYQHLLIHTNKKPFQCEICSKGFNRNSSLQRHLIIHSNEKPFKCDICYKEFNLKTNLERHLLTHSIEKRFKCDFCSKEFNLNFNLEKHLLTHSNKKRNLQNHLINDTNEKPLT